MCSSLAQHHLLICGVVVQMFRRMFNAIRMGETVDPTMYEDPDLDDEEAAPVVEAADAVPEDYTSSPDAAVSAAGSGSDADRNPRRPFADNNSVDEPEPAHDDDDESVDDKSVDDDEDEDPEFDRMMREAEEYALWCPHPTKENVKLFFLPDPSHVVKCLRNALQASQATGSRDLRMCFPGDKAGEWVFEKATWESVTSMAKFCAENRSSTLVHKLTYSAVNLTNFTKQGLNQIRALLHPRTIRTIEATFSSNKAAFTNPVRGTVQYLWDLWHIWTVSTTHGMYKFSTARDVRLLSTVAILERMRRDRELIKGEFHDLSSAKMSQKHISAETFAALQACVYGNILLIDQQVKIAKAKAAAQKRPVGADGKPAQAEKTPRFRMAFCSTDRLENYFAYLRSFSQERNPTCRQVLIATSHGIAKEVSRTLLHQNIDGIKCHEGMDEPLPPSPQQPKVAGAHKRQRADNSTSTAPQTAPTTPVVTVEDVFKSFTMHTPWLCTPTEADSVDVEILQQPVLPTSETVFSMAFASRVTLVEQLADVPGETGEQLRSLLLECEDTSLEKFADFVASSIDIDLANKKRKDDTIEWGGDEWRRRMVTSYTAMLKAIVLPGARVRAWFDAGLPVRSNMHVLLSLLIANDVSDRILANTVLLASMAHSEDLEAVGGVIPASDMDPAVSLAGQVNEKFVGIVGKSLMKVFDKVERDNLKYIAGWILHSLSRVSFLSRDQETNFQAKTLLRHLEKSVGAYLAKSCRLGPGARLHEPSPVIVDFVLKLEYYIRIYLFTAKNMLQYRKDLPRWAMFVLSRSLYVRTLWHEVLNTAPGLPTDFAFAFRDSMTTMVLQKIVQVYMKSRIKTLRHIAGIVPESSATMALRSRLKYYPQSQCGGPILVSRTAAAILRVSEHTNVVALLASTHGLTFEWRDDADHPGFVVTSTSRRTAMCQGVVHVGDTVTAITRPLNATRQRALRANAGDDHFDLTDVNPSLFPLNLELLHV